MVWRKNLSPFFLNYNNNLVFSNVAKSQVTRCRRLPWCRLQEQMQHESIQNWFEFDQILCINFESNELLTSRHTCTNTISIEERHTWQEVSQWIRERQDKKERESFSNVSLNQKNSQPVATADLLPLRTLEVELTKVLLADKEVVDLTGRVSQFERKKEKKTMREAGLLDFV